MLFLDEPYNVQMTTITKSKSVSFSFLSRPTYPVLLLIFYLQQEIKLEWSKRTTINNTYAPGESSGNST